MVVARYLWLSHLFFSGNGGMTHSNHYIWTIPSFQTKMQYKAVADFNSANMFCESVPQKCSKSVCIRQSALLSKNTLQLCSTKLLRKRELQQDSTGLSAVSDIMMSFKMWCNLLQDAFGTCFLKCTVFFCNKHYYGTLMHAPVQF